MGNGPRRKRNPDLRYRSYEDSFDSFDRSERVDEEKIERRRHDGMPVSRRRRSSSASKKTDGSRRAQSVTSKVAGGIHLRRIKKIK